MNAPAQLDTIKRAAEVEEMDTAIDLLRQDTGVRFDGIDARCDEGNARIASTAMENARLTDANFKVVEAKIVDSRKESFDNFRVVEAKIDELRKETSARIDALSADSRRTMQHSDTQCRWLVGVIAAVMLGIAGLLIKTGH